MSEIAPQPLLSLKTQLIRFVLTGGFSAIVDFGLLKLLSEAFGVQVDLAKAISFVAGTLTAYLINRRWTFGAAPSRSSNCVSSTRALFRPGVGRRRTVARRSS